MTARCVVCGKEFNKLRDTKTCGKDCSEQWRRVRNRERSRRFNEAHRELVRVRNREAQRRCRAARRGQSAGA